MVCEGTHTRRDEARARELGIRGVPFFLFNEAHGVSGAQPSDLFARVLAELQSTANHPGTSDGPGCDDQGCEPPRTAALN